MDSCCGTVAAFLKANEVVFPEEDISRLTCSNESGNIEIVNWLRFPLAYLRKPNLFSWAVETLEKSLALNTYIVGSKPTVADLVLWIFLKIHPQWQKFLATLENQDPGKGGKHQHLLRYYSHIGACPEFESIRNKIQFPQQLLPDFSSASEQTEGSNPANIGKTHAADMRFEEGGKFGELPGAKMGEVVVRFPPEASGYLHIGHAKAALLNQHYRDTFKGRLILRFDDTNPVKEKTHYEESILSDLPRIGVKWDHMSYTSDHFERMLQLCEQMIKEGKAYVDDTDMETMRIQRESRQESICRNNSIEKNLSWWEEMKQGTDHGLRCCVRAKIDMSSNNGALRDPTLYRCKLEPHIRTGSKYKVYPLYDFACPIVDSVEGVTHALRTSEYNDRNDQYAWICQSLGLRCPNVIDYSRLALQNTVLSKRKLTWFVEEGLVDGWDDPRMPTISGILRRGMTAEGLRQFILAQGSSRSSAQMQWDKIWSFNKKVIDPVAPRHTALLLDSSFKSSDDAPAGLVRVHVQGQDGFMEKMAPVHPKNESLGERSLLLGPCIYVEHADAVCFNVNENVTFINWGNLLITEVNKAGSNVTSVKAKLNLDDVDYKKTLKVTWLTIPDKKHTPLTPVSCLTYDHLLTKDILGKEEDFKLYINHNSKKEECLLGDQALRDLKKGDIIQLQRRGYFICDAPYEASCKATGHESPCVLVRIPEGTTKERPTTGAKVQSNMKVDIGGSAGSGSGSGSAKKPKPQDQNLTPEEAAKAAEKARKKEEKKEARKEGRMKAKEKQQQQQQEGQEPSSQSAAAAAAAPVAQAKVHEPQKLKEDKKPPTSKPPSAPAAPKVEKPKPTAQPDAEDGGKSRTKKQTKLAIEASKETDFAEWYSQLITKAELMDYYDISGCYILRPWAYSIWQTIQRFMDSQLAKLGVQNAYFPMFVSKNALEREKTHVTDFAPEVAWVTKSGDSDLAEPIAIRPTSETIMYPAFAKWIQSHRDLPLKINQWSNVVRWEFKHPQPFIRTREFLWQEGHTAYADKADAEAEVLVILDLYATIYEKLLAVPVIKGRKTEKEKFAGADYTTTVEIYVGSTGRAIQGATSHHLGQNFSRMFDVTYDHPVTGSPAFVYQNSWGLTTRTLGVLFMVHGDNQGLILPPRIAPYQIVIIPCGITAKTSEAEKQSILAYVQSLTQKLQTAHKTNPDFEDPLRVQCDDRDNVSSGWKFNHWELKGVPIRIEIGPKEVTQSMVHLALRHNGSKFDIPQSDLCHQLPKIMDKIHQDLLQKASAELTRHVIQVDSMASLSAALDDKSIALAPFCGNCECEENIRNESARNVVVQPGAPSMGAKSLCIPFACHFNPKLKCGPLPTKVPCFNHGFCKRDAQAYTLFGRSY